MIEYGKHDINLEDVESVTRVLHSGYLTSGPMVDEFEKQLCIQTGAKYAVVCSSATAALHIAVKCADLKKGELALTSANSFVASANCIEYSQGESDFIDIDMQNLSMSSNLLEDYCVKKRVPKVVIPVDFAGVPSDLENIYNLKKRFGFTIIEDAAHSIGSIYTLGDKNYRVGCGEHADMTIFSFHPVKTITTGEGGAILTNNPTYAERARLLRSHGITRDSSKFESKIVDAPRYYEMMELGFHYRLTDIQAALGVSQLARLEELKSKRFDIMQRYQGAFSQNKQLKIATGPTVDEMVCYHLCVIHCTGMTNIRNELYKYLLENNISTQIHYIPIYWHPYYVDKYGYSKGKCPNAELHYSRSLSIPLHTSLTESEQNYIIDVISNFCDRYN